MKPHIVIVGAGLGGCYLANGLLPKYRVTIIEIGDAVPLLKDRIKDVADPAVTYPHVESGYGGTTKVWHNALMEIDATVFDRGWPFQKNTINQYYVKAYSALTGSTRDSIFSHGNQLRCQLIKMGFPECLLDQLMYVPKRRINSWEKLQLKGRVQTVHGEVTNLINSCDGSIKSVQVVTRNNRKIKVQADIIVLASGGLGSPLLLQNLAKTWPLEALDHAGKNYDDHLMAFVGEIELTKPLYKLWDLPVKNNNADGTVRIPLSYYLNDLQFSFQLRPSHQLTLSKPRTQIRSVLTDLRNFPFRLTNYLKLITNIDDIFEILSFKFGLRFPTRLYSILMVAEQPSTPYRAVWKSSDSQITRRLKIDSEYVLTANLAIEKLVGLLAPITYKSNLFKNWQKNTYSAAHHSGTARISNSPNNGVCDINGRVHGISNLFVCDGSIIPRSGFVNTGLTIVALAMRMADHLNSICGKNSNRNPNFK